MTWLPMLHAVEIRRVGDDEFLILSGDPIISDLPASYKQLQTLDGNAGELQWIWTDPTRLMGRLYRQGFWDSSVYSERAYENLLLAISDGTILAMAMDSTAVLVTMSEAVVISRYGGYLTIGAEGSRGRPLDLTPEQWAGLLAQPSRHDDGVAVWWDTIGHRVPAIGWLLRLFVFGEFYGESPNYTSAAKNIFVQAAMRGYLNRIPVGTTIVVNPEFILQRAAEEDAATLARPN